MKYFFTSLLCALTFLLLPQLGFAMTLSAEAVTPVAVGTPFPIHVFIDSLDAVNTIQGTVVLPAGIDIKAVDDSRSIVTVWIDRPKAASETQGTKIMFSGIIPGGYQGKGELFTVSTAGVREVQGAVTFEGVEAFQNDGSGTPLPITLGRLSLSVAGTTGSSSPATVDTLQPEPFTPVVSKDDLIEGGKWFVAFNVHDKQSGINHIEVNERTSFLGLFKSETGWEEAVSPHILKDQSRKSTVLVKAVDQAGNERITEVKPETSTGGRYLNYGLLGILVVVLCLVFLYFIKVR